MRAFYLIAAVAVLLCSGWVGAEPVVLHESGRVAAAITLHKAAPTSIMWSLNLLSIEDLKSHNNMWRADSSSSSSTIPTIDPRSASPSVASFKPSATLPGIDLVVPCDDKHVLIVYGERAAVEQMKSTVAAMDVAPRQVQVKIDLFKLGPDDAKKLDIDNLTLASIGPSEITGVRPTASPTLAFSAGRLRLAEVKQSLREHGVEFISSPIINTISNMAAEVSVSSESQSWQMCVQPRVNADNTITLTIMPSLTERERSESLFAQRRVADGDTILIGGFISDTKPTKELWFLLTTKIVD